MFVGTILDGGGDVYGWVSRCPASGLLEVVTSEMEAVRFDTRDRAQSTADEALRRLVRYDVVTDLYSVRVDTSRSIL